VSSLCDKRKGRSKEEIQIHVPGRAKIEQQSIGLMRLKPKNQKGNVL
jgi:hypothetical protein